MFLMHAVMESLCSTASLQSHVSLRPLLSTSSVLRSGIDLSTNWFAMNPNLILSSVKLRYFAHARNWDLVVST